MEGLSGTKRDNRETGVFTNRIRSDSRVAEHIHRFMAGDRFQSSSETWRHDLRERLSHHTGISEDYLQICSGFNRAISSIVRAFCRPGDNAIVCGPADNDMESRLEEFGLKVLSYPGRTPFTADADGILGLISKKTKLIYLEQPNSITGTVYSRFEIEMILNNSRDVFLVLNESFYEYFRADAAGLVASYDNLIIIRSIGTTRDMDIPCLDYILASHRTKSQLEKFIGYGSSEMKKSISVAKIFNSASEKFCQSDIVSDAM
ncbi:MAG: aminotransferase class I/II-fold pyridoxal phosphate-dependent enzyme, partial [Candidatus Zixiibacteriota bacterium]